MKILVAIDFSEFTKKILKEAEKIAQKFSAKLYILHVAEPEPDFVGWDVGPQSVRDSMSEKFHSQHCKVQDISKQLREVGLDATSLLLQGNISETILGEALKLDVDMIIVGSHGQGMMNQLLVGSVSGDVLHKSKCPILVVPTHNS